MRRLAGWALLSALVLGGHGVGAEDAYRKLASRQIEQAFKGHEFADGVHWAYVFRANGSLDAASLGRRSAGRWRVQDNSLCLTRPPDEERCYEVWVSGTRVQLREPGFDITEDGFLSPAAPTSR